MSAGPRMTSGGFGPEAPLASVGKERPNARRMRLMSTADKVRDFLQRAANEG